MVGDISVIRFGWIGILNQMVPDVPFPHDLTACFPRWLDFDNVVHPQVAVSLHLRRTACGDGFFSGLSLPSDHEDIAVGQWLNIVMQEMLVARVFEIPDKRSVPFKFLNTAARAATVKGAVPSEWPSKTRGGRAKKMAVLEQVAGEPRGITLPFVHNPSIIIEQIGCCGHYGSKQRVSFERSFFVLNQSDFSIPNLPASIAPTSSSTAPVAPVIPAPTFAEPSRLIRIADTFSIVGGGHMQAFLNGIEGCRYGLSIPGTRNIINIHSPPS